MNRTELDALHRRMTAEEINKAWMERRIGWAKVSAELAAKDARIAELEGLLSEVVQATRSHVDGRDLLAELHPRNTLDIKRRVDGRETWFEGDWLSGLWEKVKTARAALKGTTDE